MENQTFTKNTAFEVDIWHTNGIKNPYVGIWRYDKGNKGTVNSHYTHDKITPSSERRLKNFLANIIPHVSIGDEYLMVEYDLILPQ